MKIAIHHRPGSFSDRWIEYCEKNGIDYKIVNAYATDIIEQVKDCDAFMWHHHHSEPKDVLFAKQLIYSLETAGIKCFPDFHTTWHFDDKVGQKYLLEAIGAPLVPSYVFYSKQEALNWIDKTNFPKVFKLRGGAGSKNVMLVNTKKDAKKLVLKAFGKGFPQSSIGNVISEGRRKHREGKMSLFDVIKDVLAYYLKPESFHKSHSSERGYAYFQDFIPNNNYDIRVIVIGDRIMAEKRYCREGDFRASGSGKFEYGDVPNEVLQTALKTAKKIDSQCVAFDFIFANNKPLIVEISYGFGTHGIKHSQCYWSADLTRHEEKELEFCDWMIENLIKQIS